MEESGRPEVSNVQIGDVLKEPSSMEGDEV